MGSAWLILAVAAAVVVAIYASLGGRRHGPRKDARYAVAPGEPHRLPAAAALKSGLRHGELEPRAARLHQTNSDLPRRAMRCWVRMARSSSLSLRVVP